MNQSWTGRLPIHKVVVNTTPIIALAKCHELDVLRRMYGKIVIPQAVYDEICVRDDIVSRIVNDSRTWISVKKIQDAKDKALYRTRLHDGEVEVMILAQEINADIVIIDDLSARSTAEYLKLPLTGTLGVLIKAKQQGIIDEVMPIIDKMQNENIYFSDRLLDLVRRKTGEGLSR